MGLRICQICGLPADLSNSNQAFCDADWARVRDAWVACLVCGQVFAGYRERNGHMNKHRGAYLWIFSGHYAALATFVRLPGR